MSQMSFDDVEPDVPGDALYVIGEGEGCPIVKIGRAASPEKRLGNLQTGNPRRLFLLHVEPGAGPLERKVHAWLDGCRLEGEWFDLGGREPVAEVQRILGLVRNAVPRPRRLRPESAPEAAPSAAPGDMLAPDEVAWLFSATTEDLAYMRAHGKGPAWTLGDSGVLYRRGDLASWIEEALADQRAA